MSTPLPSEVAGPALSTLQTETRESQSGTWPEDQVQSPSLSNPLARARFEFETGREHNGTKVLMVEWEEDDQTRNIPGNWIVSWEGKPPHVLPAEEKDESTADTGTAVRETAHRLYFLLGPRKNVPATVTLTLTPNDPNDSPVVWRTNPLPAIFPKALSSENESKPTSSKGVLHSIWAQKRVQKLESEIEEEAKLNCEGIALQMAITERDWIQKQFGLVKSTRSPSNQDIPRSPTSPLSPGGSRLSEKLRGLKLQTIGPQPQNRQGSDDVALTKQKAEMSASGTENTAPVITQYYAAVPDRTTPFTSSNMGTPQTASSLQSIGAVLSGTAGSVTKDDEEKDLFAFPLSPRSPEMTKSPFSFAAEDIRRYMGAQKA